MVYLRFQAILGRLLASREEIPQRQAARVKAEEVARRQWLSAEATYQLAKIDIKSAQASVFVCMYAFMYVCVYTHTGRLTDTHRHRQTDRQTDRQTHLTRN